jgi:hypothetical protein
MNDATSSRVATASSSIARPLDDCSFALRMHGAHFEMRAAYSRLLRTMVFSKPPQGNDLKQLLQFRRVLDDYEAHLVLALLWQASEWVSELSLAAAGLNRIGDGECLNSHSLAVSLSATAAELAKTNSRVRNIGIAGAAYGLVERKAVHATLVDLKGTRFLHEFMIELGREGSRAINGIVSPTPDAMASDQSCVLKGGLNE